MIDWTQFRPDPRFRMYGTPNRCQGCDCGDYPRCQLYFVRISGERTAHPTYYCGDCAMLARCNWSGTIEQCARACTEIRAEPRVYEGFLSLIGRQWERQTPATMALLVESITTALARQPETGLSV